MMTKRTRFSLALALFAVALPALSPGARAQETEEEPPQTEFEGSFTLGWRSVDVGGRQEKYRQHINVDDGASLFGLDFLLRPKGDFADEVRLDANNLGGQPFESIDLSIRKFGAYQFNLGRREASYFYEDVILPVELGNARLANAGDFHHFNFRRVRDFASLDFRLTERARLDVAFDRFTKLGESTTTLDVSRDEFEMDQPIDEKLDELKVNFQYSWDKATLQLRETHQEYDNARTIFLPGRSLGENTTNNTILDFYFLDQPTDMESQQHHVSLSLRPTDRLNVTLAGALLDFDLDTKPSERSQGIGFNNVPFSTDTSGHTQLDRELQLFDVDLSYLINPRVSVVAGVRQHDLEQNGDVFFGGEDAASRWDVRTQTIEAGVEVAVAEGVTVGAGLREENRDVDWSITEDGEPHSDASETDHTGYYLTAGWSPNRIVRLQAQFEDSSYDNPFTLSSPTDRQRVRLQARVNHGSGFFGSGTLLQYRFENNVAQNGARGWQSDFDSLSLRAGYRTDGLEASLGYSFIDTERRVDRIVTTAPGFGGGEQFLFPVLFQSDADFIDGAIRWQALEMLTLGANIRFYENSGSFDRDQDDYRIYADVELPNSYLLHLGYRSIDYDEPVRGFNNYDADITEFGVGYRFH